MDDRYTNNPSGERYELCLLSTLRKHGGVNCDRAEFIDGVPVVHTHWVITKQGEGPGVVAGKILGFFKANPQYQKCLSGLRMTNMEWIENNARHHVWVFWFALWKK